MRKRTSIVLLLGATTLWAAGCGGLGPISDDMEIQRTGPDLAGARLQSGMYAVSNIVKATDGCGLTLESGFGPVMVTNTGELLTIGNACNATSSNLTCKPSGYLEGSGMYTDPSHATLTFDTTATLPDGCTYNKRVTTQATFTGMNQLHADYTDVEDNYDPVMCNAAVDPIPMTQPCTSEYTFDLNLRP